MIINHDFVTYINFTHVAASNTTTDDVTNHMSHIEYLIQTRNIFVLILYSKLMSNVATMAVFNMIS